MTFLKYGKGQNTRKNYKSIIKSIIKRLYRGVLLRLWSIQSRMFLQKEYEKWKISCVDNRINTFKEAFSEPSRTSRRSILQK